MKKSSIYYKIDEPIDLLTDNITQLLTNRAYFSEGSGKINGSESILRKRRSLDHITCSSSYLKNRDLLIFSSDSSGSDDLSNEDDDIQIASEKYNIMCCLPDVFQKESLEMSKLPQIPLVPKNDMCRSTRNLQGLHGFTTGTLLNIPKLPDISELQLMMDEKIPLISNTTEQESSIDDSYDETGSSFDDFSEDGELDVTEDVEMDDASDEEWTSSESYITDTFDMDIDAIDNYAHGIKQAVNEYYHCVEEECDEKDTKMYVPNERLTYNSDDYEDDSEDGWTADCNDDEKDIKMYVPSERLTYNSDDYEDDSEDGWTSDCNDDEIDYLSLNQAAPKEWQVPFNEELEDKTQKMMQAINEAVDSVEERIRTIEDLFKSINSTQTNSTRPNLVLKIVDEDENEHEEDDEDYPDDDETDEYTYEEDYTDDYVNYPDDEQDDECVEDLTYADEIYEDEDYNDSENEQEETREIREVKKIGPMIVVSLYDIAKEAIEKTHEIKECVERVEEKIEEAKEVKREIEQEAGVIYSAVSTVASYFWPGSYWSSNEKSPNTEKIKDEKIEDKDLVVVE